MENEYLLHCLINALPLQIGVLSIEEKKDMFFNVINRASMDVLLKSEDELLSHNALEIGISQKNIDKWITHCCDAKKQKKLIAFEYEVAVQAGAVYYKANAVYFGKRDNREYFAYTVEDVTEKHKVDLENARLVAELNAIMNATTEVIMIGMDLTGTITYFNKGAENILGYTSQEVIGNFTLELFHTAKEIRERKDATLYTDKSAAQQFEIFVANKLEGREFTLIRKDGSSINVQLVVAPKVDDNGKKVGYLAVAVNTGSVKVKEQQRIYDGLRYHSKNYSEMATYNI